MKSYREKCKILHERMYAYAQESVVIAFSGGVDSSLLLKLACKAASDTGQTVYAVTAHSRLHPTEDLETAVQVAEEMKAVHKIIFTDELKEAGISNNPKERCYLCKKYLFQKIAGIASEVGARRILEGTNEDDLHVYRPGIRAIQELGIISPLAECGMTKKEVRQLAKEYEISVAARPAGPCLATRFPYGTRLTYEKIEQAELGEHFLKSLGLETVRLRVHGSLVRIETEQAGLSELWEKRTEIVAYLKKLGFAYITVDMEGFRSGSMDIEFRDRKEE